MNIVWETGSLSSSDACGHGICIYDRQRSEDDALIGFVPGFEWLHGNTTAIVVRLIRADRFTNQTTLDTIRRSLQQTLGKKKTPPFEGRSRIYFVANA